MGGVDKWMCMAEWMDRWENGRIDGWWTEG
jgi:hypothetical protein